ncbi:Lnb N-terminal periplasmic domain-containing protein [Geofilum rubicundum]|uniref:Uncharacterized protein n=1 Tax=Geofilum rubicundum JCM 15548 TaxID=1236989 RepID=A0A0E9LU48_9BACT|nr:DUF4105 domain-containing protein [Geofilum rubicundum]GAO28789.1 hypothetical protein JCM15548_1918 [Geofilum rubicundum JCM 15548]
MEKDYFSLFFKWLSILPRATKTYIKYGLLGVFVLLNSNAEIKGQLSKESSISILTCAPGDELYSIFGHTAIRVNDPKLKIDYIFNYGTFDFNTPNFYLKFLRGQLDYVLSVSTFDRFMLEYKQEQRSVWEQKLNISQEEKEKLFKALMVNYEPENRAYHYHFFFDNCATRVRDIIAEQVNDTIVFPDQTYIGEMTFRDAIGTYLQEKPWTRLGLDIILGAPTDDLIDASSVQFLPDYLMEQFAAAEMSPSGDPVIQEETTLQQFQIPSEQSFLWTPVLWLWILALFVLAYTWRCFKMKKSSHWLNVLLFSVTTVLGALITFLWFFTSHSVTGPNWHILWANPLHLLLIFPFLQNGSFSGIVRIVLALPVILLLIVFPFLPQYMPPVLWPVWFMMATRIVFYNTHKSIWG